MRRLSVCIIWLTAAALLRADVRFSDLDLAPTEQLLFVASAAVPGAGEYRTLFHADLSSVADRPADSVAGGDVLESIAISQLTHYPESLTYLPALRAIQIHNRFGLFRGNVDSGVFEPVRGFPGFVDGAPIAVGRTMPVTASPDGRYLVTVEPTSAAYGDLVLVATDGRNQATDGRNQATDGRNRTTIATRIELSTELQPALWSPDSRFFVYGRSAAVYYFSIEQYERGRILDESFRRLGPGTIASVLWSAAGSLYYVSGTLVYEIFAEEFFARSLYAGLLQVGTIVGKLPFPFDPTFDSFAIAPGGAAALLNKGGRSLFLLYLSPEDFAGAGHIVDLPALFLPRNTRVRRVLWSGTGDVTILATGVAGGSADSYVFRMSVRSSERPAFQRTADRGVRDLRLSPDERSVALLTATGVTFRDTVTWAVERTVQLRNPLQAVWLDATRLAVGTRSTIELVHRTDGRREFVSLSQADDHSIGSDGTVLARADGTWYRFDRRWTPAGRVTVQPKQLAAGRFRVYLEPSTLGSYRQSVMVRRIAGAGTSRLFSPSDRRYEPFPAEDKPVDFDYFAHGSRIRRREVALVFDAMDSVEGLTEILSTLRSYGLRTTFFVNGEFIRRHPDALGEILAAGHEVGSLFFAPFDMADGRFRVTRDFVQDGLARTEDEFYAATGSELSLLWHAPYYAISDEIIAGGRRANYVYVGRDVDSLDWVPRHTDEGLSRLYMPASQLVERILDLKQPGSIISMQIGVSEELHGGRDDYLFQRLDVLLNGLLELGYQIVPVSTLIDRAR